jgi:geranylgeranyl diphosphate synthase type II
MDDDRERRGQPTVHVKFGEDLAILAGDALLTLAFGALGEAGCAPGLVARLAEAAGSRQLVGGQVDDLRVDRGALTAEQLGSIHARKTGALFRYAICGAAEAVAAAHDTAACLGRFATAFGAAFQIADDLADEKRSETSILRVMGADAARAAAAHHVAEALRAVQRLAPRSEPLVQLALLVSQRLGTL